MNSSSSSESHEKMGEPTLIWTLRYDHSRLDDDDDDDDDNDDDEDLNV
jgi:hypothetical protein